MSKTFSCLFNKINIVTEIIYCEHAKVFCKSCLTCYVISYFVRSSRVAFKNFENMCISCRTIVCRDVRVGDLP